MVKSEVVPAPTKGAVPSGSCLTGRPAVRLQLGPFRDLETKRPLYLIWLSNNEQPIDFRAHPHYAAELEPEQTTLTIGKSNYCGKGIHWSPYPNQATLRIGIIAYDDAGNASSTVEHIVPLQPAAQKPAP